MSRRSPALNLSVLREQRVERIEPVVLPIAQLGVINELSQVRRTYNERELDDLAVSIAHTGQLERGRVAVYTADQMQRHLDLFNRAFQASVPLASLKPSVLVNGGRRAEQVYLVLIYGHRRIRAVKRAAQMVESGQVSSGRRYVAGYRADLYFDLTPEDALRMQFNENRHAQVPVEEEVAAVRSTFLVMRTIDSSYDVCALARDIGRTLEWTKAALRFYDELPERVQKCISGEDRMPKIAYGVLTEVARLAEGHRRICGYGMSEESIMQWVLNALVENLNPKAVRTRVSDRLRLLEAESEGQATLFGDCNPSSPAEERARRRRVAGERQVLALFMAMGYLRELETLLKRGLLTAELDDPLWQERPDTFSPGSPVRMAGRVGKLLAELTPRLAAIAVNDPRTRVTRAEIAALDQLPHQLAHMCAAARAAAAQEESGGLFAS